MASTEIPAAQSGPEMDAPSAGDLRVLALDPGGTTGWARARFNERTVWIQVGEDRFTPSALMYEMMDSPQPHHVVYEDFQYRNVARMGLDLTPVKLIGIIECLEEQYPFITFHRQQAGVAKQFFSDEELNRLNAWTTGKKHGRDATRHLLYWLTFGPGSQYIDMMQATLIMS